MNEPNKPSQQLTESNPNPEPFFALKNFVRNHVVVVNAIILSSTFVVAVLDFFFSQRPEIGLIIYIATGVLTGILLLAALFPAFGRRIELLCFGSEASGRNAGALQLTAVVLALTTVLGFVSLAKASEGGQIASSFPGLKDLQDSIVGVRGDLAVIRTKVDDVQVAVSQVGKDVSRSAEEIRQASEELKQTNQAVNAVLEKATAFTQADFNNALLRNDIEALRQMTAKGMRLADNKLFAKWLGSKFNREVGQLLVAQRSIDEDACYQYSASLSMENGIPVYFEIKPGSDKNAFVRSLKVCQRVIQLEQETFELNLSSHRMLFGNEMAETINKNLKALLAG